MKAFILENKLLKMEEVPLYPLKPGWVRIRIIATGICGTDVQKICDDSIKSPTVLGHEFVGVVVEGNTKTLRLGDLVIGMPLLPCYECEMCLKDMINLCKEAHAIGRDFPGSFSEYVDLPEKNCYLLPAGVDPACAVLTDVIAVCLQAVNFATEVRDKSCVVIGDGAIGYTLAVLLKIYGAQKVVMLGKDSTKKEMLKDYTDDFISIDQLRGISPSIINELFDVVFETVGRSQPNTMQWAIQFAKPMGCIIVLGVYQKGYELPIQAREAFIKQIKIIGSNAYLERDFNEAIKILENHQDKFRKLITKTFLFDDLPIAVEQMKLKKVPTVKHVVLNLPKVRGEKI